MSSPEKVRIYPIGSAAAEFAQKPSPGTLGKLIEEMTRAEKAGVPQGAIFEALCRGSRNFVFPEEKSK